jgi:hypothetical protein
MTMLQNQARKGLPNVLHDASVPNTIRGIGLPTPDARFPLRVLTVAAAAGILAVPLMFLVLVFVRAA